MGKKFDCVQMKLEIQNDLLKENTGVSDEEFYKTQLNEISKNTTLAQFLKKVKAAKKSNENLIHA
ncbi:MAG: hypothetical protein ACUZ8O_12510 [Candidatus Anammoxibacter sp.]